MFRDRIMEYREFFKADSQGQKELRTNGLS